MLKWRFRQAYEHIRASADKDGPNSGPSINIYMLFVYESSDDSGKSTHLH